MEPLVSGKAQAGSSEPELRNLIVGLGDGLAAFMGAYGSPVRISEAEAITVSKPASRILARHPAMDKAVQAVADPAALVIAVMGIAIPRYAYARMVYAGQMKPPPATVPPPSPPPPRSEGPPTFESQAPSGVDTGVMDKERLDTLRSQYSEI